MRHYKFILTLFLFCFCRFCFCNTTDGPVFAKKETLYSTKSGKSLGELSISVEAKSAGKNNNEWYLIIGSNNSEIIDSKGDDKSLWIFNKRTNANDLKKELKNKDYPIEVKDISQFMPFCENGIRFDIKDWEEVKRQTQLTFFLNASPGEKITLRLVFYYSSRDKKRTTIEDEAKVKLDFILPDPSKPSSSANAAGSAAGRNDAGKDDDVISLTEKIDYDALKKEKEEKEKEESLNKEQEEKDRGNKVNLVNAFITERNEDIASLQNEVNILLANQDNKVEEGKIDSFVIVLDELKKKVDYWEKGYTEILLTEISIHDKFAKFSTAHGITAKRIDELRLKQNQLNNWLSFLKNNWLLSIGVAAGSLILLVIMYKLGKWLFSFVKRYISQARNKVKIKNHLKKQLKTKQKMDKKERNKDFDNIDINELHEI